jgi:RNA polymerase sigma-70 factor (ECF subfamily)
LDDQLLIRRILTGDAEAFRGLYRNYAAVAWHVAISVCKNHLWAEEAVQSAFISAYQNLSHFRSDSSFKTWLIYLESIELFALFSIDCTLFTLKIAPHLVLVKLIILIKIE